METYTLIFSLSVPSFQTKVKGGTKLTPIVPSWNEVLAMEQWARAKRKSEIQDAFLSALQASVNDCSTRITFARSTLSTAADTLASYRATVLEKRKSKSPKGKPEKVKKSTRSSKCMPSVTKPNPPLDDLRILNFKGAMWLVRPTSIGNTFIRNATPEDIRTYRLL